MLADVVCQFPQGLMPQRESFGRALLILRQEVTVGAAT
jgi:hypothetical protein